MQGYFTYIIKTWIATMVTTPGVFVPLFYLFDPGTATEYNFFEMIVFLIFIGFAFSIPNLLLIGILSRYFEKVIDEIRILKLVTIVVSIVLIIISFAIFFNDFIGSELSLIFWLAITYIASICGFGYYFKIKTPKYPRSFRSG